MPQTITSRPAPKPTNGDSARIATRKATPKEQVLQLLREIEEGREQLAD